MINIYVDGSYNEKTKTGGYGAVILFGTSVPPRYVKGCVVDDLAMLHHNVAGECMAVYQALHELDHIWALNRYPEPEVTIHYDYEGIEKWATGDWKATKPFTQWYQNQMQIAYEKFDLKFVKVKAHSGDEWNDKADRLAKEACGNA